MSTPLTYYRVQAELDAVKARAFLLLMSDEIETLNTPFASALFDMVGDTSESEALANIALYEDTK